MVEFAVAFAVQFALGLASSIITQALFAPERNNLQSQSFRRTVRGSAEPRRVAYGIVQMSGVLVYIESDNEPGQNEEDNNRLHQVFALADHQIHGVAGVWLNDEPVGRLGADGKVDSGQFHDLNSAQKSFVQVNMHEGRTDQAADGDLVARRPETWTSDHRLRGVAYAYTTFWVHPDFFTGFPNVKFGVTGKLVADWRDTPIGIAQSFAENPMRFKTTVAHGLADDDRVLIWGHAGGAPAVRGEYNVTASLSPNDEFTIDLDASAGAAGSGGKLMPLRFSNNSALCLADYLVNPTWGLGADPDGELDVPAIVAAANLCDEEVPLPGAVETLNFDVGFAGGIVVDSLDTDTLVSNDMALQDGEPVVLSNQGGALPSPLAAGTVYYVRDVTLDGFVFKLAATLGGPAIDITSNGSGTHRLDSVADFVQVAPPEGERAKPLHPFDGVELSTTGALPAPLAAGTRYWVVPGVPHSINGGRAFRLAATLADARAFNTIVVTDTGTGSHTLTRKSQPRYTTNGVFSLDRRPVDVLPDLINTMFGKLVYTEGKYVMFAGAYNGPPVATLTESDLNGKIGPIRRRPSKQDLFNAVRVTFFDQDDFWTEKEAPQIITPAFETQDGGDRIFKEINLPFVTDTYRAQRIGKLTLQRGRDSMRVGFPAKLGALDLAVLDTVLLDVKDGDVQLFNGEEFEVVGWRLGGDGVSLDLQSVAAQDYDWDADNDATIVTAPPALNLMGPLDKPTPPSNLTLASGTAQLLVKGDGTIVSRIRADWTKSKETSVQRQELQFKKSADSNWEAAMLFGPEETVAFITQVEDGVAYDVRIRAVNRLGLRSNWAQASNHSVIGKTAPPPPVDTVSVARLADGRHEISWAYAAPPVDWAGVDILLDGAPIHRNVRGFELITDNATIKAPGAYTVGAKAVDTTGNKSTETTTSYNRPAIPPIDAVTATLLADGRHLIAWTYTAAPADWKDVEILIDGQVVHRDVTGFEFLSGSVALKTPGSHTVGVKAVDTSGNKSSETTVGYNRKPMSDVGGFQVQQNGTLTQFRWSQATDIDLKAYELRFARRGSFVWANAILITKETKGTLVANAALPPGDWTAGIKAIDTSGNESVSATTANVTVPAIGATTLRTGVEQPRWTGALGNFARHDVSGRLVPKSQDLAAGNDFAAFDGFVVNPHPVCTYEAAEIDLGADVDQARTFADLVAGLGPGATGAADPIYQVDHRLAAGSYDGFEDVLGALTADFRYLKPRAKVETATGVAYLEEFAHIVDRGTVDDGGSGVAVAVGGTAIGFGTTFTAPPNVQVTVRAAAPRTPVVTNVSAASFTVKVFDSGGADVGGAIDWIANGA